MEVFIRSIKGEKLKKFLRLRPSRQKNFYKIIALAFSFLPAILIGNLVLGINSPKNYNDKLIAFEHVATPVIVFFDGQREEFTTEKATPEEALSEKGIKLEEFDITVPERESELCGTKTTITVKRARPVEIVDNGKEIKAKSAYDTVDEILSHLDIKVYPEDRVMLENPLDKVNLTPKIIIDRQNPIVLSVDGKNLNLKTHAHKVSDLINECKIKLAPSDLVDPGLGNFVTRGMVVSVIRVNENTVVEQVEIPYDTQYVYDNNLSDSDEAVIQEGALGLKEQVANIIYQNGYEAERIVLHEKILSLPKNSIIKIGTKQVYSGTATWYGPGFEGGSTASGEPFNPCTLTAAHRTLPFGTLVRVTNLVTGRSCVVRINDRGPYSYHIIDLTRAAADAIGMESVAPVMLQVL